MSKRLVEFVVPVIVLAVFLLLNIDFDGRPTVGQQLERVQAALSAHEPIPQIQSRNSAISTLEERVYDLLLRLRSPLNRAIEQRDDVLFVDVDDTAIVQVGDWPWPRDYMARGLIVLREFDSDFVTFDIEYVEESQLAVDREYLTQSLPRNIENDFYYVTDNFSAFVDALQNGQIPLSAAGDVLPDLYSLTDSVAKNLQSDLSQVVRDNDEFLGRAAAFHGKAYFTVNILEPAKVVQPDPVTFKSQILPDENRTLAVSKGGLTDITREGRELRRTGLDMLPAIPPILSGAAGAGFPNVVVDNDGVRRRIDLIAQVGDTYFGQLIFAPMLDLFGNPAIDVTDKHVLLRGAVLPGATEPQDIQIPLASDGRMLINWPDTTFLESFRHETFYRLVDTWQLEEKIIGNLRVMNENGILDFHQSDVLGQGSVLIDLYDFAESLKDDVMAGGDRSQIDDWRSNRQLFFEELGKLLDGDAQQTFEATYDAAINDPNVSEDLAAQYQDFRDLGTQLFNATRDLYEPIMVNRKVLQEVVPGSKIIIGWTGTSTTDIGVNPFEQEYVNVGTHAAVYNTIVQQQFLDDTSWWVPWGISGVLAIVLTLLFVLVDLDPGKSIIFGFSTLIVVIAGGAASFVYGGLYVNLVTPVLVVFVTFTALTIIKFLRQNQEKRFIRDTFDRYLAPDVIDEILEGQKAPELRGDEFEITALFTDVQKFSTISEKLTPVTLVELMNRYLDPMSAEILTERGTIDKFEGDAIIAFFGAPIRLEDHATRACRAAVQMKKLETELNKVLIEEELTPSALNTRVGLNSGNAVIGNMGTERKMNYTMMGNTVNLAARLEGVNKQYGTWILMSQQTYDQTGRAFSVRKLDRVRVVGIDEPVRLYELIDLRENVDQDQDLIQKLRMFNSGLTAFEEKNWDGSRKLFQEVLDKFPEDGPSRRYIDLCTKFRKNPPSQDWDGVFNLTSK